MNPYARFGLVSNSVSAALIVGSMALFGAPVFEAITATAGGTGPAMWGALGGAVAVLVVFWLAMTEAIFPTLFRFNVVRKAILGKYYIEGTWLQAERGGNANRMSVIDIQPDGKSFIFSGYALNEDLEVESNTLIEFSKLEWPFMTYKYRNSLSDGADGQREGVGELQFEMNASSARRYNGYAQFVKNGARLKIEGNKLTSGREVKHLRSLEGRQKIFEKYWELFFNASIRKSAAPVLAPLRTVTTQTPVTQDIPLPTSDDRPVVEDRVDTEPTPLVERRSKSSGSSDSPVVPRRRTSDWRKDDEETETHSDADDVDTDLDTGAQDDEQNGSSRRRSYRSRPARY